MLAAFEARFSPLSLSLPLQGGGNDGARIPGVTKAVRDGHPLREGRLPRVPSPLEGEGQGEGAQRFLRAEPTSRDPPEAETFRPLDGPTRRE